MQISRHYAKYHPCGWYFLIEELYNETENQDNH